MSDILCVTSRQLCREDFLARLERIAAARPAGIVLREKDLSPGGLPRPGGGRSWRSAAAAACPCILHAFPDIAEELGADGLHLPLPALRLLSPESRKRFRRLGASCHSAADAREAAALGCTYITAGHVFDTACKAGTPGRGLAFLREVCRAADIPVWAIGGIAPGNFPAVLAAGARGGCVMSGLMTCGDPAALLAGLLPPRRLRPRALPAKTRPRSILLRGRLFRVRGHRPRASHRPAAKARWPWGAKWTPS